jgi:hypothetical protein
MTTRRHPVVTDVDRQWAVGQEPDGWSAEVEARWLEIPEHQRSFEPLTWAQHVAEQAERFEAHFADDRKPAAEWSGLWRRAWWPKADASVLHPREVPGVPPVLVRRGDDRWLVALTLLTDSERKLAIKLGVMPFKLSDPRIASMAGA